MKESKGKTGTWIEAMRPRTLPLALASILMGIFLAAGDNVFNWPVALLCLLTAVLLQILSNLANDYGDSLHGADHLDRIGPSRAVQRGQISAQAMKRMIVLFVVFSMASGLAALWLALGSKALLPFVLFVMLGGAAIGAAITYTAGNKPYGYAGLGDIAVLIFFGWVGVLGTYFLQAGKLEWSLLLPATSNGLLTVAVLNVNNIRDMESDRTAGKLSIPVRLGLQRARLYHWSLLIAAGISVTIFVLLDITAYGQWLYLLSLPLLWQNGKAVSHTKPSQLDPLLRRTSLMALAFVFIFGFGQIV